MSKVDMDLEGKVIVITGAGGFICGGIAKALANSGAKLALMDHRMETVAKTVEAVKALGGDARPYVADVLDKAALERVHEEILRDYGKANILINGAGGNNPKATCDNEYMELDKAVDRDFFSLEEEGIKYVFDLNYLGTFLPTQVFAKDMIGVEGCSILNISSMNAFTPLTKIPAYSGAKAAISNLTEWLAVHFSRVGIRVNAIAPGFFVTRQNKDLLFDKNGEPTARTAKILAATPMGRFGEIDEIMGAVKLLINSKEASFITGVVVPIDGGFNAYSGV